MGTQKKVPSRVGGDKDTFRAQCFCVLMIRASPGKDLKAKSTNHGNLEKGNGAEGEEVISETHSFESFG